MQYNWIPEDKNANSRLQEKKYKSIFPVPFPRGKIYKKLLIDYSDTKPITRLKKILKLRLFSVEMIFDSIS
jgi:hypothetical protein